MPFEKNDPRINRKGRPPGISNHKKVRALAKEDSEATWKRIQELRDQGDDLKVSLEASKLAAAYSDGLPGPAKSEADDKDNPSQFDGTATEAELEGSEVQ